MKKLCKNILMIKINKNEPRLNNDWVHSYLFEKPYIIKMYI